MIEYYVKEQAFRQFGESEKKTRFVARLDEKIILDTDELCQRVADRSTLAKGEMRLALDMFCEMVRDALKRGRAVRIGDLGVLHPVLSASLQDKKEDVTVNTIKEISCSFRLSNDLKKEMNQQNIRKIEKVKSL